MKYTAGLLDPTNIRTMADSTTATISPENLEPLRTAGELPIIFSPLSGVEILARLDGAARRGKLPGFHKGQNDSLFHLADFGSPFESALDATAVPTGAGTSLSFELRLKPLMPWVFVACLVLSVWPGVWLTDSMLKTYFISWYTMSFWWTCAWYMPLTVPFVPIAILQSLRRSRASAKHAAMELITKVRALVGEAEPEVRRRAG